MTPEVQQAMVDLGVGERQARRRLRAAGLSEPRRRRTATAEARMRALLAEGLPADWIAEDIDEEPRNVRKFAYRQHISTDNGWKATRLSIVKNPALRALHEEFAP